VRVSEGDLDEVRDRESAALGRIVVVVRWAWAVLFGLAAVAGLWLILVGATYGISWALVVLLVVLSAGCLRVAAGLIGRRSPVSRSALGGADRIALVVFVVTFVLVVSSIAYLAAND
jgi:hypothetical protein